MHKLVFAILSLGFISSSFAQTSIAPTVLEAPFQGVQVTARADNDVEGNPYVFSDWKKGEVTLINGESYPLEKINLNAERNKFLYVVNDTLYEFSDNIRQVKIYDNSNPESPNAILVFRNNVDPESDNFVELLDTGKITIFQAYDKKPEGENYSNGIVNNTRKYSLHTTQFALVKHTAVPIKYNSSTLDDLTADKRKEVEAFVKENKLKVKKESDFLKVITFYNSIAS